MDKDKLCKPKSSNFVIADCSVNTTIKDVLGEDLGNELLREGKRSKLQD